jgi:hypothetical protein
VSLTEHITLNLKHNASTAAAFLDIERACCIHYIRVISDLRLVKRSLLAFSLTEEIESFGRR